MSFLVLGHISALSLSLLPLTYSTTFIHIIMISFAFSLCIFLSSDTFIWITSCLQWVPMQPNKKKKISTKMAKMRKNMETGRKGRMGRESESWLHFVGSFINSTCAPDVTCLKRLSSESCHYPSNTQLPFFSAVSPPLQFFPPCMWACCSHLVCAKCTFNNVISEACKRYF